MRGKQTPTYSWCDSYTRTEGQLACKLADAYGIPPHPWQRLVLNDWLALDDDGKLLNSLCVLPIPRQNGKTNVSDPRETWGLVYRREWILHTAQEYQTAKKAFDRLREKFGTCKNDPYAKYPELNRLVDRYTTSANQMVLDLTNGGHIEFRTRGSNSDMGRGGTFDLVVIDEAQSYTEAQDAALSPLNSAAPHGSPQTILMGTVPDPSALHKGEKFTEIRAALHDSPQRGDCIHEWAAPEVGDVNDIERWYEFNPSLGYQLLETGLRKDVRTMTPDKFAQEHLGYWPERSSAGVQVLSNDEWTQCATNEPCKDGLLVYAVKFSPDGATAALSVCRRPDDGIPHVEVIKAFGLERGMSGLVSWLVQRESKCAQVVIDGQSAAQTLIDKLLDAGFSYRAIVKPSSRDMAAACAWLVNAVREKSITHFDQPALNAAAVMTVKRRIGTAGGWGFQSTETGDATLIESVALAYWSAMTTKRDPDRSVEIF